MLRVDPAEYARQREQARLLASQRKTQKIEKDLEQATFKPTLYTKRRVPTAEVPQESEADLIKKQLTTSDIFEAPLPATLKRLNMNASIGAAPPVVDSLNAAMKAEKLKEGESKRTKSNFINNENVNEQHDNINSNNGGAAAGEEEGEGVYRPRESYESLGLRSRGQPQQQQQQRGLSQADADAAFKLSLRGEEEGYNLDAVVPAGTKLRASKMMKGGGGGGGSTTGSGGLSRRRGSPAATTTISPTSTNAAGMHSPSKAKLSSPLERPAPKTPPSIGAAGKSHPLSNFDAYLSPQPAAKTTRAVTSTPEGMSSGKKKNPASAGAGTGTGGKSRPSSAGAGSAVKSSSNRLSPLKFGASPGSGEKGRVQVRNRLSLLKSKMGPRARKSESARPSRRSAATTGADASATAPLSSTNNVISPTGAAREKRRASLSAAVSKFQSDTFTLGDDNSSSSSSNNLNMSVSASESQLDLGSVMHGHGSSSYNEDSDGRSVYQPAINSNSNSRQQKGHLQVHKAAKVDKPTTFRARRDVDMEGFNPITGEPLSPVSLAEQQAEMKRCNSPQKQKQQNPPSRTTTTTTHPNMYRSIEIQHKEDAEKAVPRIFLDLPEDAFAPANENLELIQCPTCDRKFGERALAHHVKACKTVFLEKPKVFNSSRMRISGVAKLNQADNTEMMILEGAVHAADGMGSTSLNSPSTARLQRKKMKERNEKMARAKQNKQRTSGNNATNKSSAPKWKSESEALRKAMVAARGVSAGDGDDSVAVADNLTPCPHCSRRFNQKAADRHIPQCQNIVAKPKTLKKKTGMAAVAKAIKVVEASKKILGRIL
jgi:hypothetical protein